MILLLIIFFLITIKINGGLNYAYIENTYNHTRINQYRTCDYEKNIFYDCVWNPPKELIKICGGDCPLLLEPLQVIGNKPKISFNLIVNITYFFIFLAFVVNHLLYIINKKKLSHKNICIKCGYDFKMCECGKNG